MRNFTPVKNDLPSTRGCETNNRSDQGCLADSIPAQQGNRGLIEHVYGDTLKDITIPIISMDILDF
jgi:hypothetical protein